MTTRRTEAILALALLASAVCVGNLAAQEAEVNKQVNADILREPNRIKSYRILLNAAIDAFGPDQFPAPTPSGYADADFNIGTIHPGMANWSAVSDWAESAHSIMADAVLQAHTKKMFGLPYGTDSSDPDMQKFVSHGMFADLAVDGNLRDQDFAYLRTMDTISAFVTADTYRLLEAGKSDEAMDLTVAHLYVLDQLCDRGFVQEKIHAMRMLIDAFELLRDQMHLYLNTFTIEQLASPDDYDMPNGQTRKGISFELPWLRMDLLQMPEGDRVVADALIKSVFDDDGFANPDKFSSTFARLQAKEAPLTQFGAARRWRLVANWHSSIKATEDHLTVVYDDWWRRWSLRAWHELLNMPTQFSRTNPVRYAAVTYSLADLDSIFPVRRELISAANATTLAAALCGYRIRFNTFPNDLEKVYAVFVQKRSDTDPFDKDGKGFGYRFIDPERPEEIVVDGIDEFVEVSGGLLWSRGNDYESQRGTQHSGDGLTGDIVYWPPIRAVAREQGLIE